MVDWGPCEPWPVICEDFPPEASQEIIDDAIMVATETLWQRSKQQFGLCEVLLRPCKEECAPAGAWLSGLGVGTGTWSYPFPTWRNGQWLNLGCGSCQGGCSCSTLEQARLPYPVENIIEVTIDGVPLPSSAYRVDNWNLLVRVDGGSWPSCNDLTLPDTEIGTWSVRANIGRPVPKLGQLAAGEIATEIVKYCLNDNDCLLPAGSVQEISRQGVTKTFFDPDEAFTAGRVGFPWSDLFMSRYNPSGAGVATVYNIDNPPRRVGTGS